MEDRRRRLAQFLSECLAHPELQASPQLRAFATLSAADAWLAYQRSQPTSKNKNQSTTTSASRSSLAPPSSSSPSKDSLTTKDSLLRPTLLSPDAPDAGEDDHDGSSSSDASIWQGEPSEAELVALEAGVGGASPDPSALDLKFAAELQALAPLQAQLAAAAQALAR